MEFKNIFKKNKKEDRSLDYVASNLLFGSYSFSQQKALLLSTVYRCVEVISDSVAQLPIYVYKVNENDYKEKYYNHPAFGILNSEPNHRMTIFTLIKCLVSSMLLQGNGYALIKRDSNGRPTGVYYVKPDQVTLEYDTLSIDGEVKYIINGYGTVNQCDMIHLLNYTNDGVIGISTLANAKNSLEIAWYGEEHAKQFFESGCSNSGIIKVQSSLTKQQKLDIKKAWAETFGTKGVNNGLAVLEGNMDYQSITVDPETAQLLETRKFNVVDICRFFGVSPVKCFDLSNSSYSTVEATQLAFLTDTLSPLIEKLELEFERKLFLPSERPYIDVKFDTSVLLRADKTSQAEYYTKLFQSGVYSVNEIRRELDLPHIDGADDNFVQVNMQKIKNFDKIEPENQPES